MSSSHCDGPGSGAAGGGVGEGAGVGENAGMRSKTGLAFIYQALSENKKGLWAAIAGGPQPYTGVVTSPPVPAVTLWWW
ncbi:hypothetical protein GCM10010199_63500 [Dactylosporangium roseum]